MEISSVNIHQLRERSLKKWWQVDDFFRLSVRKQAPDKFRNKALQAQFQFLLTTPISIAILIYAASQKQDFDFKQLQIPLAMALSLLAVLLTNLAFTLHRHLFRALTVETNDAGITLKSFYLTRNYRWDQIRDYFQNQDGDYILITTSGEEFILSSELTGSDHLFKVIARCAPKPLVTDAHNYRLPNEFLDSLSSACVALSAAIIAIMISNISTLNALGALGGVAALVACAFYWQANRRRLVEIIRVSDSHLHLRTASGAYSMTWQQVKSVKQFGELLFLKTDHGWFLAPIDKKDSASTLLIEQSNRIKQLAPYPNS